MTSSYALALVALLSAASSFASPKQQKIAGVPFYCVNAIQYELIRDFAAENRGDVDAIANYRKNIRLAPAYACRERKNPTLEHIGWCDGSGCSGATASLRRGKCAVYDKWTGQDDGDAIDEEQFAEDCLLKSDF